MFDKVCKRWYSKYMSEPCLLDYIILNNGLSISTAFVRESCWETLVYGYLNGSWVFKTTAYGNEKMP